MKDQGGYAAPLVFIVILLTIGFLLHLFSGKNPVNDDDLERPVATMNISSDASDWKLYTSRELGFEIKYPGDFTIDENYHYTLALPTDPSQNPIPGVAFMIPDRFRIGTNLSSDSKISVEFSKDFCEIDKMVSYGGSTGNIPNATEELGNTIYERVTRSDAGAGNFYSETLYSTGNPSSNGNCYGIRMFLHSHNVSVLRETNPYTREYDKNALTAILKDMIETITFIK